MRKFISLSVVLFILLISSLLVFVWSCEENKENQEEEGGLRTYTSPGGETIYELEITEAFMTKYFDESDIPEEGLPLSDIEQPMPSSYDKKQSQITSSYNTQSKEDYPAEELDGDVNVFLVFLEDEENEWDRPIGKDFEKKDEGSNTAIAIAKARAAAKWLETMASIYKKNGPLSISANHSVLFSFQKVSGTFDSLFNGECPKFEDVDDISRRILNPEGSDWNSCDIDSDGKCTDDLGRYMRSFDGRNYDHAAILYIINGEGRSCAYRPAFSGVLRYGPAAFIFNKMDSPPYAVSPALAYAHELLHVFGACDGYVNEKTPDSCAGLNCTDICFNHTLNGNCEHDCTGGDGESPDCQGKGDEPDCIMRKDVPGWSLSRWIEEDKLPNSFWKMSDYTVRQLGWEKTNEAPVIKDPYWDPEVVAFDEETGWWSSVLNIPLCDADGDLSRAEISLWDSGTSDSFLNQESFIMDFNLDPEHARYCDKPALFTVNVSFHQGSTPPGYNDYVCTDILVKDEAGNKSLKNLDNCVYLP